jgi:hypothetical protein
MQLIKVTKKGNLYFTLANGKWAAIYPETKYVRFKTNEINPHNGYKLTYQVKKQFNNLKEQVEYLLAYEEKYCK